MPRDPFASSNRGRRTDRKDIQTRPARSHGVTPHRGPHRPPPNFVARRAVAVVGVVGLAAVAIVGLGFVRSDRSSTESASVSVAVTQAPTQTDAPGSVPPPAVHDGFHADALYVALYGKIGTDLLGVLGEQEIGAAVERAATVAAQYDDLAATVVPTFEIIASVASFESGDGDYSNEASVGELRPWVDAADENEMSVILDLQSGREPFHLQVRQFEELLLEPHVGVAIDPEWRVGDDEVPKGGKVGSVTAAEINATSFYLAELVKEHDLPRKILVVHQFRDDMILDRSDISESPHVQVIVQMDGFGPLRLKRDTYAMVAADLPAGVVTGWKNFYDEDSPTPTPEETMTAIPPPVFVSYQ